jgi:hypothetical protein
MRLPLAAAFGAVLLAAGCQPPTPAYRCSTRADCPAGWECNSFRNYCYRGAASEGGVGDAAREDGAGDAQANDRLSRDSTFGDQPHADARPQDAGPLDRTATDHRHADAATGCDAAACTRDGDSCVRWADCVAGRCVRFFDPACGDCVTSTSGDCQSATDSCTNMQCDHGAFGVANCDPCVSGCNCVTTCSVDAGTSFPTCNSGIGSTQCVAGATCTFLAANAGALIYNCAGGSDCALICHNVNPRTGTGCTMTCRAGARCLMECPPDSSPCNINTDFGMTPPKCDASICDGNIKVCNRPCPGH